MNIRQINPSDVNKIRKIYNEYFNEEFEFPDFLSGYLSSFVVTSDEDKIIIAGGVRTIAESVIITDKSCPITPRREALQEILTVSAFTASFHEYKQLHAFIQDENWLRHLKRVGFKETVGKSIVLNL